MARRSEQIADERHGKLAETGLVRAARFIQPGAESPDAREVHRRGGRRAEEFYRERWRHDKSPGARLERTGVVHVAALRRLPEPGRYPPQRARNQRTAVAEGRRPILIVSAPTGTRPRP
jgi:hypothetical protein